MGLLGSTEKPPKQIVAEREDELASEVWDLIEREKTDLEKIRQLEQESGKKSVTRAERALRSLAVGIEEDLDKLEEEAEEVEHQGSDLNEGEFRKAAKHNLGLLESAIERLESDDNNLEKWLKMVDQEEKTEEKLEDMLEIETKLEEDLDHIEGLMKNGGPDQRGWIDLQQFN